MFASSSTILKNKSADQSLRNAFDDLAERGYAPMDVTIRQATLSDATALSALVKNLGMFSWMDEEDPQLLRERLTTHLARCLADDSHSVFVAQQDEQIIGYGLVHWLPYLILRGPEGYISELFVGDESRGAGVGALLLDEMRREAIHRGCFRLSLLNRNSRPSYLRNFYPKNGFVERPDMVNFILPL